jgi:hypothetical protein
MAKIERSSTEAVEARLDPAVAHDRQGEAGNLPLRHRGAQVVVDRVGRERGGGERYGRGDESQQAGSVHGRAPSLATAPR